jgi:hypothetical protein
MKKVLIYISLFLMALSGLSRHVEAQAYSKNYEVVFDGSQITSDFSAAALRDYLSGFEPGDNVTLTFDLINNSDKQVEWYMYNHSKAFEESRKSAKGAIYQYRLTYSAADEALYDSDKVGGEESKQPIGINEATDSLAGFFLLSAFAPNEKQTVTIYMALDGETQTNTYQDTLSDLIVNFAVEEIKEPDPENRHEERIIYIPYTGDTSNITLYLLIEAFSVLLLIVAILLYHRYRKTQRRAS